MAIALTCPSCGAGVDPDVRACGSCGTTLATRRCGVCLDLNLADSRNCRSCGRRLPEEDAAARPDRLPCAGCGSAMTPRRAENLVFDECDRCGGLWISPTALESVNAEAHARALVRPFDKSPIREAASAAPARVSYRRCPVCSKPMNRSNYARGAGIVIDLCRDHGGHFDPGELSRLFDFVESGGLERARRREAEEVREEIRDARRKAAAAAAGGMEAGPDPIPSTTGMDLLQWIARIILSGR